jgi:hypothetical protein
LFQGFEKIRQKVGQYRKGKLIGCPIGTETLLTLRSRISSDRTIAIYTRLWSRLFLDGDLSPRSKIANRLLIVTGVALILFLFALPSLAAVSSSAWNTSPSTPTISGPMGLVNESPQKGGEFGFSTAVSSSLIVVGEPYAKNAGDVRSGIACIYSASTLTYYECVGGAHASEDVGYSVAVTSSYILIGAPGYTTGGADGAVFLYSTTQGPTGDFGYLGMLTSLDPVSGGNFGFSVAISGSTIFVGAPYEGFAGSQAGNVYFCSATTISCSGYASEDVQTDGYFAASLAASGRYLVIGAPGQNNGAGSVYVWDHVHGAYDGLYTLTSNIPQANGGFGESVAINGQYVVVGAPFEDVGGSCPANCGDVQLFSLSSGTFFYSQAGSLANENLGASVAIDGNNVVMGAPGMYGGVHAVTGAGEAYVFNIPSEETTSILTSANPQVAGEFGNSVAASGSYYIVGAYNEKVGTVKEAGNAYEFTT